MGILILGSQIFKGSSVQVLRIIKPTACSAISFLLFVSINQIPIFKSSISCPSLESGDGTLREDVKCGKQKKLGKKSPLFSALVSDR